ncbi:hypothetical protein BGZ65_006804 [Modicella reniformis]|uniref:NADH dehydrogenase [ubiquinone] 1 alpha subcomplex assembly factor 3 n=1 Tax=Modicella reniformis TaxID=1440133 RepID=A0A9P6MC01_9FUNG|nr:hypothetical protein BGZ65_006804 [Modicella reniformis]
MIASITLRRTALSRLSSSTTTRPFTAAPTPFLSSALSSRFSTTSTSSNDSASSQQQQPNTSPQLIEGLRQKSIPNPGTNEDASSAISGFMNMFNDIESKTVSISTCTKHGFVTTEAIALQGPVLCIGGQVFLWDIFKESGAVQRSLQKNTHDSSAGTPTRSIFEIMEEDTARDIFKVFELMNPRPEILIVGTGKSFTPLSSAVRSVIRGWGLQVDMMSTVSLDYTPVEAQANAAATYNMLAEEGREVAAALLPLEPSTVQVVHGNQQQ